VFVCCFPSSLPLSLAFPLAISRFSPSLSLPPTHSFYLPPTSLSLSLSLSLSFTLLFTLTFSLSLPPSSCFLNCSEEHCDNSRLRNTLQHTATRCNTLQHTATHSNTLQHTATYCNILQHTATHCNVLQRTATRTAIHYNALAQGNTVMILGAVTHCITLQHTATQCNTLQHTATHCNTLAQENIVMILGGRVNDINNLLQGLCVGGRALPHRQTVCCRRMPVYVCLRLRIPSSLYLSLFLSPSLDFCVSHRRARARARFISMGWLRLVGSLKL